MQFKPHGTRFAGVADSKGGLGEPNLPTNQHNQWLACLAFKKKKTEALAWFKTAGEHCWLCDAGKRAFAKGAEVDKGANDAGRGAQ